MRYCLFNVWAGYAFIVLSVLLTVHAHVEIRGKMVLERNDYWVLSLQCVGGKCFHSIVFIIDGACARIKSWTR